MNVTNNGYPSAPRFYLKLFFVLFALCFTSISSFAKSKNGVYVINFETMKCDPGPDGASLLGLLNIMESKYGECNVKELHFTKGLHKFECKGDNNLLVADSTEACEVAISLRRNAHNKSQ